jgi:hypothetical protein
MTVIRPKQHRVANFSLLIFAACCVIMLFLARDLAAQCAMCRTALTQSAEGERWSRGINAGILLLLATPFLIAGACLLVIFRDQTSRFARNLLVKLVGAAPRRWWRGAGWSAPRFDNSRLEASATVTRDDAPR